MSKFLTVQNLNFAYENQTKLLKDINFDLKVGEILTFLGQNGSGKTTLLKLILGFLTQKQGSIKWFLSNDSWAFVKQFSVVNFNFPMSVYEFLELAFLKDHSVFYRLSVAQKAKIDSIMDEFGLSKLANAPISQLSGGERQKLLIAQALLLEPTVLLLDEPFNNIDARYIDELIVIFKNFVKNGRSIISVNHDWGLVRKMSDRVILLKESILAQGNPQQILSKDLFLKLYF